MVASLENVEDGSCSRGVIDDDLGRNHLVAVSHDECAMAREQHFWLGHRGRTSVHPRGNPDVVDLGSIPGMPAERRRRSE